ncbi:proton-coupled folate transporter-like [Amphiura filiformis]|uniref:proton-coupled folate transporter-like n=1 Tax=Amphiura filiformis TaxID=82378 RepID=UPI003B22287B
MAENGDVKTKPSRKNMKFLQPAPPDAPPNLQRAASRYITVEPILMFMAIGTGVMISVLPQYLRYRVAMEQNVTLPDSGGGNNGTCVARNRSNPYYVRLQEVQAEVAFWQMVRSLCGTLPALFTAPLLGAWSDIVGRKLVMGLNAFGSVVYGICFILTYYLVLPIWTIPVGYCITGILGGSGLSIAQANAYLADVTNNENRLLRIAVFQSTFIAMMGLSNIAVGYLIRDYGFGPPLVMMCIAYALAFLYIIFPSCLIETVDTKENRAKKRNDESALNIMVGIKNDLICLFKTNTNLRRWRLCLLYFIDFMRETLESSSPLVIVYGLGPPFCWSSVAVSRYWMMSIFGSAIAVTVVTKGLSLCLPDIWNLQSSMVFNILYGYLHAFANSTIGLYIAGLVGCFRNISQPLIPAMLAKMVSDDEHGKT